MRDATVKEEFAAVPAFAEGRNAAPTVLDGGNEASTAEEAEERRTAAEGRDAAPMVAEGRNEAEEGSNEATQGRLGTLFMWGFGRRGFADLGAAGAALLLRYGAGFSLTSNMRQKERVLCTRGVLE